MNWLIDLIMPLGRPRHTVRSTVVRHTQITNYETKKQTKKKKIKSFIKTCPWDRGDSHHYCTLSTISMSVMNITSAFTFKGIVERKTNSRFSLKRSGPAYSGTMWRTNVAYSSSFSFSIVCRLNAREVDSVSQLSLHKKGHLRTTITPETKWTQLKWIREICFRSTEPF